MGNDGNLISLLLNDEKTEGKTSFPRRRRQETKNELEKSSNIKNPAERSYFSLEDLSRIAFDHPIPCFFSLCVLFFMIVEYTLPMIPSNSPPFDLGFALTKPLQKYLASRPNLNSVLAGFNTVKTLTLWFSCVMGNFYGED